MGEPERMIAELRGAAKGGSARLPTAPSGQRRRPLPDPRGRSRQEDAEEGPSVYYSARAMNCPNRLSVALLQALAVSGALLTATSCQKEEKKQASGTGKSVAEAPAPTGSGVVKGVVKLTGAAPPPERWAGAGNAECKGLHPDTIQLVKAQDGKLADVFVYVKEGLPKGSYPTPTEPVAFDQKGCEFEPRVFGVMTGQPLNIGNSDKLMHNVKSPEFNQAFPFGVKKTMELGTPSVMATIKCDVHPWMRAYAGVMDHPYFVVTKADGAFELTGLVDGEYSVEAWHEKLGAQQKKVKVSAAAPAVLELELAAK